MHDDSLSCADTQPHAPLRGARRVWAALKAALTPYRDVIAAALALLAVVCMALSAYGFQPRIESLAHYRPTLGPKDYYDVYAPWAALTGALLLIGALAFARRGSRPVPARLPASLDALRPVWAWVLVVPGTLLLLAAAEINGGLLGVTRLWGASPRLQLALLVGGILLVGAGLGGVGWARRDAVTRAAYREVTLLLILTALALGVRFWHLGDTVRVMVDESHFALGVTYFWAYPDTRLLTPMPTSASFPFIYAYGQSGMVAIFGRNLWGLRALSAVCGALTVPALYLLARELFDRTTAILAGLVLLTFPPNLHYSRLALNNIADPLFGTLALALLARALRTRQRWAYALGGVMLGLTQYFYEGGRILFPALAGVWLAGGFILWRAPGALRLSPRGVAVAALAFVLVAMPVYYTLAGIGFPLFDRIEKTEMDSAYWERNREPDTLNTRFVHFKHSLLAYVNGPENTVYHYYLYYGGKHPLVLETTVPAFLLGLVIAAWRWRSPGVLPVLWVLATSAGNALLVESAVSARYVVVFPALALLIALGIRCTLPLIWPGHHFLRAQTALMLLLAAGIAIGQGAYYFGPFHHLFEREVRLHVMADAEDALLRSRDFPPGTQIHLVADGILPQTDAQHFMNFLADNLIVEVIAPDQFTPAYLKGLPRDVGHAFFVRLGDPPSQLLATVFPGGAFEFSPYDVPDGKALVLFYVPAEQPAPAVGWTGRHRAQNPKSGVQ